MKIAILLISILALLASCSKSKYKKNCCTGYMRITTEGFNNTDSVYFAAPNAFTPNADGYNDVFMIFFKGIDTTSLDLVIRQGKTFINDEEVFRSYEDGLIWDGTNGSSLAKPGTYSYNFSVMTIYGQYIFGEGEFCLIDYDYTKGIKNCSSCYFGDQFDFATHTFTLPTAETYCDQ